MDKIRKLILENKAWSMGKKSRDPDYFTNMAKDQKPDFLWIGCSDSRVDPRELTNTQPGEMFVHRNIANLVIDEDSNLQSVIQYSVEVLKVDHVIICGHYNCGGVRAAMGPLPLQVVDRWIQPIRVIVDQAQEELSQLPNDQERVNRSVELNVRCQLESLGKNPSILREKQARDGYPILHGWVYDLHTGLTHPLTDPKR
jgi:carbonic anhydrase